MQKFQIKKDNFKEGLSTLRAWIKFLKYIFHISYKLELTSTTNKTPAEGKSQTADKIKEIHLVFGKIRG